MNEQIEEHANVYLYMALYLQYKTTFPLLLYIIGLRTTSQSPDPTTFLPRIPTKNKKINGDIFVQISLFLIHVLDNANTH